MSDSPWQVAIQHPLGDVLLALWPECIVSLPHDRASVRRTITHIPINPFRVFRGVLWRDDPGLSWVS
jgi:hypothetical protein